MELRCIHVLLEESTTLAPQLCGSTTSYGIHNSTATVPHIRKMAPDTKCQGVLLFRCHEYIACCTYLLTLVVAVRRRHSSCHDNKSPLDKTLASTERDTTKKHSLRIPFTNIIIVVSALSYRINVSIRPTQCSSPRCKFTEVNFCDIM